MLAYRKGDFENPPTWIEYVARKLPPGKVRVRRDWDRFLKYCCAVALWRSFGRKKKTDISFKDYCIAYRILEPVFASTLYSLRSQEYGLRDAVARLEKRLGRSVDAREIAEEVGWEKPMVYKHLKSAVRHQLVKYEGRTREHNLTRRLLTSIVEKRFENLNECGLKTHYRGKNPSNHQLEFPSPRLLNQVRQSAKITTVLLQCRVFHRERGGCGDAARTRRLLKTIRILWCREGESNPQGTKYRRILSPRS